MAALTTFQFADTPVNLLIKDAYERCGIDPSVLTGQQIEAAKRSLNLLFSSWANEYHLWTVTQNMFTIIPGQADYQMPYNIIDVADNEMIVTNATRVLGGIPYSSAGGNPSNCFSGNISAGCTQTSSNGYISYDYGSGVQFPIKYVGIQTNSNNNYTIAIEYSFDNIHWFLALQTDIQAYLTGLINWFVIPAGLSARAFRIRETGGATLDINEIYFDIPQVGSRLIQRLSRENYLAIPNKVTPNAVSSFELNRTIQSPQLTLVGLDGAPDSYMMAPTLSLYSAPDTTYSFIVYNARLYIKDVNTLTDFDFVPQAWIEALTSALAAKLCIKFKPELYQLLRGEADNSYRVASFENRERVPISFRLMENLQ